MGSLEFTLKLKADFLGVLAHPARLRLLEALKLGGMPVGALAREAELSQPVASKHLGLLRQAGIVESSQVGRTVHYRVCDPSIYGVLRSVNALLQAKIRRSQRTLRHLGRRA